MKLLQHVLKKRGVSYEKYPLELLLAWLKSKGLLAETPQAFDCDCWKKEGDLLFEHASKGDANATRALTTWCLVYETLKEMRCEKTIVKAASKAVEVQESKEGTSIVLEECKSDSDEEEAGPVDHDPGPLSEHKIPSAPPLPPGQTPERPVERQTVTLPLPSPEAMAVERSGPGEQIREGWRQVHLDRLKEEAEEHHMYPNNPGQYQAFNWELIKEVHKAVM